MAARLIDYARARKQPERTMMDRFNDPGDVEGRFVINGSSQSRGNAIIDITNSLLVDSITVGQIDGEEVSTPPGTNAYALMLSGIRRSDAEPVEVLVSLDSHQVAVLCAELVGIAGRAKDKHFVAALLFHLNEDDGENSGT